MRLLVANLPSYLKLAITMISNGLLIPPTTTKPKHLN